MSVPAACERIAEICAAQAWLRSAPTTTPSAPAVFPFAAVLPDRGRIERTNAAASVGFHTLRVEVHWPLTDIGRLLQQAKDHVEALCNAIASDPTLAGTVATITALDYEFTRLGWAGTDTVGYVIRVEVKILY